MARRPRGELLSYPPRTLEKRLQKTRKKPTAKKAASKTPAVAPTGAPTASAHVVSEKLAKAFDPFTKELVAQLEKGAGAHRRAAIHVEISRVKGSREIDMWSGLMLLRCGPRRAAEGFSLRLGLRLRARARGRHQGRGQDRSGLHGGLPLRARGVGVDPRLDGPDGKAESFARRRTEVSRRPSRRSPTRRSDARNRPRHAPAHSAKRRSTACRVGQAEDELDAAVRRSCPHARRVRSVLSRGRLPAKEARSEGRRKAPAPSGDRARVRRAVGR